MNSSPSNQSETALHAVDYWQVVKNRYGIILLTLLLVFMTAAVVTYVMPKKYDSEAKIEVRSRSGGIAPFGEQMRQASGGGRMSAQFFGTEFQKITSTNALTKVVDNLELVTRWNMDKDTAVATLKGIITTQIVRQSDLISIRVRHQDKQIARDIALEVVKAYEVYRADIEGKDAQRALIELNKAVRSQQDKVEERRKVLTTISRTKGIIYRGEDSFYQSGVDEDQGARSALQTFNQLEEDRIQLESQIKTLLDYDSDQLMVYASGLELPENIIKILYPQYLEAKRQLETLGISGLGNRHPTVLSAVDQIERMKVQLDEGVVNLKAILQAKLDMSKERLISVGNRKDTTKDEAIKRGQDTQDYVDAKREFETDQGLLQQMKIKQMTETISEKMSEASVVIHDAPKISKDQSTPNIMCILLVGGIVGLVFGIGIAFFLEYLDTSVKSLEDVERYLQVPVLAVIPKDVGILHKQNITSPDAEAYRILRTNIEFNRKNPEDNAITVVSGGAGEGKSTTLVNLAYICAQGGYTTLMIDADLRRPRLHTFFDINNSVGLTNYLTTELMLEDVILQTPVDNLYFMPSGILPSDAAGILNSRRMSELIQDVKQRFDLVLVDSPPILGVSDASVLASEVDLTMIVVQHRKLPRNMLVRVKQAVENVGGNVIGVVLNNVDVRSDSQYQYYTSYYTYYAPAESQVGASSNVNTVTSTKSQSSARSGDSELY